MSLIIAHRGACHFAPENTVPAFRKAVELGVDGIETDVQLTKDGELVIHHNYEISGTSACSGKIADMTLAELKALDFGSHKGAEFVGTPIATLEECLDTVQSLPYINLELKAPMDRTLPFVSRVIEVVQAKGLTDRVVLSAFDHSLLREAKEFCPSIRTGALTLPPMGNGGSMFGITFEPLLDVPLNEISPEHPVVKAMPAPKEAVDVVAKNPISATLELMYALAALYPGRTLREAVGEIEKTNDLCSYVRSLDFPLDFVHPSYISLLKDPSIIDRIGLPLSPYTVDKPEDMVFLRNAGVYGIITNRPDILLALGRE